MQQQHADVESADRPVICTETMQVAFGRTDADFRAHRQLDRAVFTHDHRLGGTDVNEQVVVGAEVFIMHHLALPGTNPGVAS